MVHAEVLQRAEPLLALLDRHALIVVGVQDQRRRLHVLRRICSGEYFQ